MKRTNKIGQIVNRVNRRRLRNNTQKVLLALLGAGGEWVARTSLRIPSAASRIRDLRTLEFGKLDIECASAAELGVTRRSVKTKNPTYYRLNVASKALTVGKISKIFDGAIQQS